LDGTGVDREGSLFYDWIFNTSPHPSGFSGMLSRVAAGKEGFEYADVMDADRLELLRRGVEVFDKANIRTILLIPPVAGEVADAMQKSGRYGILRDMHERLASLGHPFFDFHDPRSFGSSDCEFVDGMHGGEVTALRMLSIMTSNARTGLG